ncbi:MAG: hypothetical protein AAF556_00500 [Pseudomonadota bacterium]
MPLDNAHGAKALSGTTKLQVGARGFGEFDQKSWLGLVQEGLAFVAPTIFKTTAQHDEIVIHRQWRYLRSAVPQTDAQTALMGFIGNKSIEGLLLAFTNWEASTEQVIFKIANESAVEPLIAAQVKATLDHWGDSINVPNIQPTLIGLLFDLPTHRQGWHRSKVIGIFGHGTAVKVTNRRRPAPAYLTNLIRQRVVQIQDQKIYRSLKLHRCGEL